MIIYIRDNSGVRCFFKKAIYIHAYCERTHAEPLSLSVYVIIIIIIKYILRWTVFVLGEIYSARSFFGRRKKYDNKKIPTEFIYDYGIIYYILYVAHRIQIGLVLLCLYLSQTRDCKNSATLSSWSSHKKNS